MSDWQPIETAPKDGTVVRIWNGKTEAKAWYEPPAPKDEWWEDVGPEGTPIDEPSYAEYLELGYHGWISIGNGRLYAPSHWQPISAS